MSSGMKEIIINTQERAISPDINRLQKFKGADIAEMMRYMLDTSVGSDDLEASAQNTEYATLENPLRAEIINGLLVRPQQNSLNLLIDPGVMYAIAPDGAADDSNYKYVHDTGVTIVGALAIPTNVGAGGVRVSVVECQLTDTVLETDSRDVFNSVTGLFTATAVNKARGFRLTYRVRVGTAGGGFPGTALGWLPLCIASAPDGAPDVNSMTFWDVRPLMNDRIQTPFNVAKDQPSIQQVLVNASTLTATGGIVEATLGGRRVGGRLRSGSTQSDTGVETIDLSAATNQEPGIVFTSNRPWYLYFMTPFGLPRWARYTTAGFRIPRSPRGIPIVSMVVPDPEGRPSSAISLPTLSGLGSSSSTAVAVAAGYTAGSAQGGFFSDGKRTILCDSNDPEGNRPMQVGSAALVISGSGQFVTARYDMTAGTHYPTHAREILCEFRADIGVRNGFNSDVRQFLRIFAPNGGAQLTEINMVCAGPPSGTVGDLPIDGGKCNFNALMWVSLPPLYPTVSPAATQRFDVAYNASSASILNITGSSGAAMRILGWRMG